MGCYVTYLTRTTLIGPVEIAYSWLALLCRFVSHPCGMSWARPPGPICFS